MRRTRKAINNLSLRRNIIIWKAPILSGIKHLCASRAQNDALDATLSHSAQAQSTYEHPVRRMMHLTQHWVTARRHKALMRIPCAEWCTWRNTESQRAGTKHLWASRAQNDALDATLSHSAQAQSTYAHPVRRMMHLTQHWVTVRRHKALMSILCAGWCAWSNTESQRAGTKHLWASCAQDDALDATLSHSAQAQSTYEHPVRRMMRLKQHWVSAFRPTALMHIPCAEWCAWSNTESQRAGTKHLCASRAQNDALEATLSHSAQAQSTYEHPVRRMMHLTQHWVTARRHKALMRIPCAEWCTWRNTESQRAGTKHLWASRAQNDALDATLSHSAQAQSTYAHPVRRMMHLTQHWVTVRRHKALMSIPCAGWCAWSNTESQRAGTKHLWASCAQNDALDATLSHSAHAQSTYEHPVRRMMCLKQHWVSAFRPTALMHIPCTEWCAWSNTESQRAGATLWSLHRVSSNHKGKRY